MCVCAWQQTSGPGDKRPLFSHKWVLYGQPFPSAALSLYPKCVQVTGQSSSGARRGLLERLTSTIIPGQLTLGFSISISAGCGGAQSLVPQDLTDATRDLKLQLWLNWARLERET